MYAYDNFLIIGNSNEGWSVFANQDVWVHEDGGLEYSPHSDYGAFNKFKEALAFARSLERGLSRGDVITLEYSGPVRHSGALAGTMRHDPETGGSVLSYPEGYSGRAAHEWGHARLARKKQAPKDELEEEREATRLAVHVLKATKKYTQKEKQDLIRGLASYERNGKAKRIEKATAFVEQVEKEPPKRFVLEEWEREWAKEASAV